MMAIFGFIVLLVISVFLLGSALAMLKAITTFGGARSDKVVFVVLLSLSAGGFYVAYKNSPITVSMVERTNQ